MFGSFDGIKIYIYARDHNPPHFHVYYGEYEAIISIKNLEILAGELPSKQYKRVIKWAEKLQAELLKEFLRLQG